MKVKVLFILYSFVSLNCFALEGRLTDFKVIDGDTIHGTIEKEKTLQIDDETSLRIFILKDVKIRMARYNAPETRTRNKEEKRKGLIAKMILQKILIQSEFIKFKSEKKGKFGRHIGELENQDGNINNQMIKIITSNDTYLIQTQ